MPPSEPIVRTLPRRDWVLLPLIVIATPLLMFLMGEGVSRAFWPERFADSCKTTSQTARANCTSRTKLAEGPWVENHYNECGYRTESSCAARPPGTLRVVVMGASFAAGYMVPYRRTFAAEAAENVSRTCRRPVEVEAIAGAGNKLNQAYQRTEEAIRLVPDVLVIAVTPHELEISAEDLNARKPATGGGRPPNLYKRSRELFTDSNVLHVLEHFLLLDESMYVKRVTHSVPGYFRKEIPPDWQEHYRTADVLLGEMADRFHRARVPVILMPGVMRDQAALAHERNLPPDVDPHAFHQHLAEIAARQNISYIDTLRPFKSLRSQDLFYAEDTHPNAEGEEIFADLLARKLLDGSVPAFAACVHGLPSGPGVANVLLQAPRPSERTGR